MTKNNNFLSVLLLTCSIVSLHARTPSEGERSMHVNNLFTTFGLDRSDLSEEEVKNLFTQWHAVCRIGQTLIQKDTARVKLMAVVEKRMRSLDLDNSLPEVKQATEQEKDKAKTAVVKSFEYCEEGSVGTQLTQRVVQNAYQSELNRQLRARNVQTRGYCKYCMDDNVPLVKACNDGHKACAGCANRHKKARQNQGLTPTCLEGWCKAQFTQ